MVWVVALALALIVACGGGGGSGSGDNTSVIYPTLGIFLHDSESPVICDRTVYDADLFARCVYRDRTSGKVLVQDIPTDYLSEARCVEDGLLEVDRYFYDLSELGDPSSRCFTFPDKDLLGAFWVVYSSSSTSPYLGGDFVSVDPITYLASYPFPWWGSDLASGEEARRRMDKLSQYAGFPSYPDITSPSDHNNFLSQAKSTLGLPSDAPKEVLMDALMERRLQERGVSFGEYFASVNDPSRPVLERSFREREESGFSFASYCSPADTFACPLGDLCTVDATTFDCLKFHSGKLALRIYYDSFNESFFYCFYALDERTGEYVFVGMCSGLTFTVPSLLPDEFVQSYSKLYCEDSGIHFTVKCYAELTTSQGRTLAVSNYFAFDLARY